MSKSHIITFTNDNSKHELALDDNLSEKLNSENSPILFGCRTGICGTCLVKICKTSKPIKPPCENEREILDIFNNDDSQEIRLACQLKATTDMELQYVGK